MLATTRRSISASFVGEIWSMRVPKAPVVERFSASCTSRSPAVGRPPVRKGELGARGHDPVEDQNSDVGPHRCRSIRRVGGPTTSSMISAIRRRFDHRPGSGEVPEAKVSRPLGDRRRTCHCRLDVLGFAQERSQAIFGFAVHPGHLRR